MRGDLSTDMSNGSASLNLIPASPALMSGPRLLIYSHYSILLDVLSTVLGGRFDVTAVTCTTALLNEIANWYDAVVLDVGSADDGSLRAMEVVLSRRKLSVVLLVTDEKRTQYAPRFLCPRAVCRAEHPLNEITAALMAVAEGNCLSSAEEIDVGCDNPLTDRQIQVLRLISTGLSAKEIANSLGLSVRTAEFHRAAIMNRLGLRTSAELTRFAMVSGLSV